MQSNLISLLTILGMAVVTYLTRLGGFWLIRYIPSSPRVAAALQHMPGAILLSLLVPKAFSGNLAEMVAMLVTVLVALRTKQVLLPMILGVTTVWLLRHFL